MNNKNEVIFYGKDRAEILIEDWWDMFDYPENPMYKEALSGIIAKYNENVVKKSIKRLVLELQPRRLPPLAYFKKIFDTELINQRMANKPDPMPSFEDLSDSGDDDQRLFFRNVNVLLKKLGNNQITLAEYKKRIGNFFKAKGMIEEAEECYELARQDEIVNK